MSIDNYPDGLTPEALSDIADMIKKALDMVCEQPVGFALITFDFQHDEGKDPPNDFATAYISNGQRPDMIRALRESALRLEMRMDKPPGGQAPGLN